MSNLATLIARAAADLKDAAHAIWSADELTAHLRQTLRELEVVSPRLAETTLTPAAGSRTLSLATLGEILALRDLWYPHDDDAPSEPPARPAWRWLSADAIWLELAEPPDGAHDAHLLYSAPHTIDGLDSASATSLSGAEEALLLLGATAAAAEQVALARTGAINLASDTPEQWARWAQARRQRFDQGLRRLAARRVAADPRITWDEEV